MQALQTAGRFVWPERPHIGATLENRHMTGDLPADRAGLYQSAVTAYDTDCERLREFQTVCTRRSLTMARLITLSLPVTMLNVGLCVALPHLAAAVTLPILGAAVAMLAGGLGGHIACKARAANARAELADAIVPRYNLTAARNQARLDEARPWTNADWERVRSLSHPQAHAD